MESINRESKISFEYTPKKPVFKSRRDELVSQITEGINLSRIGTKYKKMTKRAVALIINKNPFLARSDDEIELVLKDCLRAGNFKKFFWVVNQKLSPDNPQCDNSEYDI